MKKKIKDYSPTSLIISKAIVDFKLGKREKAIELLNHAEELIKNNGFESTTQQKLIESVRKKYCANDSDTRRINNIRTVDINSVCLDKKRPGVSLVNCVRNRTENLIKALPTWLEIDEINEIIIVDWTSDTPIKDEIEKNGINDKRIRIVRVENEPRWILSIAFNLGFRLVNHERVIKVDADIKINTDFFNKNKLKAGSFIAGDWQKAEKGQEHINGFFYAYTNDLLKIRGFNEYLTTYGWDDDDIYSRLSHSGLFRISVDTKSIYHIPHDDSSRINISDFNNKPGWLDLNKNLLFKIRANRYLTLVLPYWNENRVLSSFKAIHNESQYLTVQRLLIENKNVVSESIKKDSELYAALEILSWKLGSEIYHVEKNCIDDILSTKCVAEISKFDIDVAIQFGNLATKEKLLYIELDCKKSISKLDRFFEWLRSVLGNMDLAIILSSNWQEYQALYGKEFESFLKLKYPVRLEGLHVFTINDLRQSKKILVNESVSYIKVTDSFLSILENQSVIKPIIHVPKRKFYVDVQHGLGNRLRAYGSAAAIARATGRELVVVWVPDNHCDCRMTDLFEYTGEVIESYEQVPDEIYKYNYMEIEKGSIKDQPIILRENIDTLVRSAFVLNHPASNWITECAEIRNLKLTVEVMDLIRSIDVPEDCVGLHVRMEAGPGLDNNSYDSLNNWSEASHQEIQKWRTKSHYSRFFTRINKLLNEGSCKKFFLATDLKENYEIFKNEYNDKVIYLERDVFDRSRVQILYALADSILLSKCNVLLGSTWSSFTELAIRIKPEKFQKIEMSGEDF